MSWLGNIMRGGGPTLRFQLQHRVRSERVPRHLTAAGEMSEQTYVLHCSCGWQSPPEHDPWVRSGAIQDHLWHAWREQQERGGR